jgi:hypothetical protein
MYPPRLKKFYVCFAALVAALFLAISLGPQETYAVMRTAKLTVSARVIAYLQFNLLSQVSEITITEEDIQRGYLDVRSASRLVLKTNSNAGYMMTFEGNLWPFKEVQIQGLSNPVQLNSGHVIVHQPSNKGQWTVDLSYRFILSEDTKPGSYSWPLSLSVLPM